jgi:molybdate transport system substrate-binding protein
MTVALRRTAMALGLFGVLALLAGPVAAQPVRGPLVLAAASLQESLTAAADAWTAKGNLRPVLSFAASSVLARQIDAGAPADLFLSADEPWMDFLAARKLTVPGTRTSFLNNTLVLVAPKAQPFKLAITPGFALAAAMADPDAVPAGKYGRAALTKLGVWRSVESKVVRAENVRAALLLVARDEAAAGIVYATDARATQNVVVVGSFPATSHAPIVYPLAQLASSRHRDAATFRAFLLSPAGKQVFARYGFGTR